MLPLRSHACLSVLALALLSADTEAQCGSWSDGFSAPGFDQRVVALRALDLGPSTPPALYAGGAFAIASTVTTSGIARWDGTAWSALGPGLNNSALAIEGFDDGAGLALYAGGAFTATQGGGVALARVGRWNGTSWSAVGGGVNDQVFALAVYDSGAGPELVAAGVFTVAGGASANRIARWNGTSWSALGTGLDQPVFALSVFDDGGGPALYAAGEFTLAGGAPAEHVARWNGTSWSAVGNGFNSRVRALHVHDEGGGPALYAGGNFASSGALPLSRVARWNGSAWSALGAGVDGEVFGLGSSTAGELWVGGMFTHAGGVAAERVARWAGSNWSPAGSGMTGGTAGVPFVGAFATFDEGAGPRLFAGGDFLRADGRAVNHVARWDGGAWSPVPAGGAFLGSGASDYVLAYGVHDFGGGPELVAGGRFDASAGGSVKNVARWDGSAWQPLGAGFEGGPSLYGPEVRAFASYDAGLGAGSELYAVGRFTLSGGVLVNHVARWDGALWQPVGGGLSDDAFALAVFDDGTGPALYTTGFFTSAGGVPVPKVARWNGTAWTAPPVNGPVSALAVGVSLAVWDDGSGPALIVGGNFGTQPFSTVASYRAGTWTSLGFGGDARTLAVFDASSGPELFTGGTNGIWRRGAAGTWSTVIFLVTTYDLHVFDDGAGPVLFAAGQFQAGQPRGLARWRGDGSSWTEVAGGLDGPATALGDVDDGTGQGPTLFVGGTFTAAGGRPSRLVARLGGCDLERFCAGDGLDFAVTTACPCGNFGGPGRGCASNANANGGELIAVGRTRPDGVVLHATGLPASTGVLFLAGDARVAGGAVFGDGVRCIDGSIVRLALRTTAAGAAEFPSVGDPLLSVRSGTTSGSGVVAYYQAWYRSTAALFCPPATSNVTNGVRIRW
ncbi:MAG: hypothetical protein IPJ77_17995 [Planctomycetes bacterium]|nr:hypothetical protein [Planctomycetota bacterium]